MSEQHQYLVEGLTELLSKKKLSQVAATSIVDSLCGNAPIQTCFDLKRKLAEYIYQGEKESDFVKVYSDYLDYLLEIAEEHQPEYEYIRKYAAVSGFAFRLKNKLLSLADQMLEIGKIRRID